MGLDQYLYYDETSPSGLRWKCEVRCGKHQNRLLVSAGVAAGFKEPVKGYWIVRCNKKNSFAHRVIWELYNGPLADGEYIDHIDGDTGNNLLVNLRKVTKTLNARNKAKQRNNTSGTTGVYKKTLRGYEYWIATWIELSGKRRTKAFSFLRHGEQGALLLAQAYRAEVIQKLNTAGGGYTGRHGKETT